MDYADRSIVTTFSLSEMGARASPPVPACIWSGEVLGGAVCSMQPMDGGRESSLYLANDKDVFTHHSCEHAE